jgi:membrane-associated phospholipid phosphatase
VWRAVVVLCLLAAGAQAEPWHKGRYGKNRVLHLGVTVVGGALYPATDFLETRWAPTVCNWCEPTDVDRGVRDALRWENRDDVPRQMSHVAAFALSPIVTGGLLLLYTPPTWADVIDDLVPVAESWVITLWITRAIKMSVGRQRPYAHYGLVLDDEDNLSFPSGHTSRVFSVGMSAAWIAHVRGYRSETAIWVSTGVIGAATAYLRIAADKHYFTDVLAGAALGSAVGLTVPWLMKRDVEVVPTGRGIALAGAW